ncbi:MAG: tRNA (adenosine(37)-N6)-threonylcarbamoyltransferase complex dimerization subunit type 1 TsaB [Verrucomicrobiaceae bacterium]|jgi:tRNA threonylcarbamoyl adenosine modification protein YeaZ|nr:MAG: tRNA (adenosine(37)-N6)-threonylcarbamoyltransferase complex dimerization subunit type 1 TsaB [Verrucomicrobiaceae bacterium]HBI32749.1 tRNA (adenosine(37)-N6)-threonylcarbamoyltransferase complex dimerization subunit type 1 TsaB [Verrucomicrobiales bacterium]
MAITKNHTILALETSVAQATMILANESGILSQKSFRSERSQECDLFTPLLDLLSKLPSDTKLSAIVVGIGPGSYNGTRVGIATAQAIAQVHGCRVAGLCSFEGVPEAFLNKTIWAVGDARRDSYFLMPVQNGRAQIPPKLLDKEEFSIRLAKCEGPKVTFESPERLPENIGCLESHSSAGGLLKSFLARSPEEQEDLLNVPIEAFYLRPPHITKSKKTE